MSRPCMSLTAILARAAYVKRVPLRRGDFRPWSKDELQTMKEAGDKEASKLEQMTEGQAPSADSSRVWLHCLCSASYGMHFADPSSA